jgi:hypothetical protein
VGTILHSVCFHVFEHRLWLVQFCNKSVVMCLQKYNRTEVKVSRKDGLILIREMAAEVKNMMDIKMNAVMVSTVC